MAKRNGLVTLADRKLDVCGKGMCPLSIFICCLAILLADEFPILFDNLREVYQLCGQSILRGLVLPARLLYRSRAERY